LSSLLSHVGFTVNHRVTVPCAVVAGDIAGIRAEVFLIVRLSSVFAFSDGSMVLATIDAGSQGIAGGSGQAEIGPGVVLRCACAVSYPIRIVLTELSVCSSICRLSE